MRAPLRVTAQIVAVVSLAAVGAAVAADDDAPRVVERFAVAGQEFVLLGDDHDPSLQLCAVDPPGRCAVLPVGPQFAVAAVPTEDGAVLFQGDADGNGPSPRESVTVRPAGSLWEDRVATPVEFVTPQTLGYRVAVLRATGSAEVWCLHAELGVDRPSGVYGIAAVASADLPDCVE